MPTFQDLLNKVKTPQEHQQLRLDTICAIERLTSRPLTVYAGNTRRGGFDVPNRIDDSDITGFSDLIESVGGPNLDVLVHSPGGSAEATERIVNLLRENFSHIRFLVPHSAYSAATMLVFSGNEILMDERSTLGPIDPQIIITTPQGISIAPVEEILDGFAKVRQILKEEPGALGAYLPMLQKYDLHIFETCQNAKDLAESLAKAWLRDHMFQGLPDAAEKAAAIVEKFASHHENLSHGRAIGIKKANEWGLRVRDLRESPDLRQALWKLYTLIEIYFDRTPAVKLFENSHGVSWARNFREVQLVPVMGPPGPQVPPPVAPPAGNPQPRASKKKHKKRR